MEGEAGVGGGRREIKCLGHGGSMILKKGRGFSFFFLHFSLVFSRTGAAFRARQGAAKASVYTLF